MTDKTPKSCELSLAQLQTEHENLTDALQRFYKFQERLLGIKQSPTRDATLDQMECLLDEVVDFIYAQVHLHREDGGMEVVRGMVPDGLRADASMIEWALEHQQATIIPVEGRDPDDPFESLLLLPLPGNTGPVGIVALWVDFDASAFTHEQSTLLNMLARETATVLEAQAFRRSQERAHAVLIDLLEAVPHGVLGLDPERRVTLINSTMEFMFGVRRNEILERPYDECLPDPVVQTMRSLLQHGSREERELSLPIAGIPEALGIQITPIHGGDTESPGSVMICRDLKLSREVSKLREVDSLKNDFLSLVSHELRTPLTSILAYTETLLMEGIIDTEEERREYLQIIYDEGERLTRLINDVLDLTKMEAGKMEYLLEERDLNEVLHNAVMSSDPVARQKGLTLRADLAADLPVVRFDPDRIMQVLMNFLSNAIKFTDKGGRVTVVSESAPPLPDSNTPSVRVSVIDTGIGIAPENLDKVFSKFEQIESIDHHSIGTGLGMPICKQIVEEGHGGEIGLTSEPGKGTTFFFRIPVL